MKNQKHNFSLFSNIIHNDTKGIISIKDENILHRILNVLRLNKNDFITFFDEKNIYDCIISEICKKKIICQYSHITKININEEDKNYCIFLLPLISREYMESALYSCAQNGINEIYYINYTKSQSKPLRPDRVKNIFISACEQSKQYRFPRIHEKIFSLEEILANNNNEYFDIYAEKKGGSLAEIINTYILFSTKNTSLKTRFTCGPEGGFTNEELALLDQKNFKRCSLTESILRSSDTISFFCTLLKSL